MHNNNNNDNLAQLTFYTLYLYIYMYMLCCCIRVPHRRNNYSSTSYTHNIKILVMHIIMYYICSMCIYLLFVSQNDKTRSCNTLNEVMAIGI